MSVYRRDVIEEEGGEPGRVLASHEGFELVAISAGQVRSRDQTVHADPLPEIHAEGVCPAGRVGGRTTANVACRT